MPSPLSIILFGVLLPALATVTVLIAAWRVGRRLDLKVRGGLAVALALGLGDLAGHLGVAWPAWPPSEVTDRIPILVGVAILAALVAVLGGPGRRWLSWVNRAVVSGVTIAVIVSPAFGEAWSAPATLFGAALLGIGMILAWANLDALATRCSGAGIFLPLLLISSGASVALLVSGSMVLALLAGVLSAALAACGLVAWRVPAIGFGPGGPSIVVVVLASLLLINRFYAELPSGSVALFAVAPAAVWFGQLGTIRSRAPWIRTLAATAAVLVPVALAIGLAVAAMPSYEY
ncbi:hypothetical protein SAMN05444166_0514 [Singulisphaera sp. GP187]|uniref:hypothetical protein n=1 Tax=Singulisphaera sp. GP187 TaxID=1882752 RepID=UPI00092BF898|nr:hypothetical protein [Singulisphaera sp. GP187]SIN73317.1 hypothetical protein SAMN05444166_0514 [Singulisphaera sp. GP187]